MAEIGNLLKANYNEAFAEKVKQMGYDEIYEELQNILSKSNPKPKKPEVPLFFLKSLTDSDSSNPVRSFFASKRKTSYFQTKTINANVIDRIKREIGDTEKRFDDIDFKKLSDELGYPKNRIFLPTILNNFITDSNVFDSKAFLEFAQLIMRIQVALISFSLFDPFNERSINEDMIFVMIANTYKPIKNLQLLLIDKQKWYLEYYQQIVVCYFQLFCAKIEDGKIDLLDLISSNIFMQYINMDNMNKDTNPLSLPNATKLYNTYLELDRTQEGLLNGECIKKIEGRRLTSAFIKRLVDVIQTFEGESIDFTLFIRISLYMRYMHTKKGTSFFFKIIDIDGDGVISRHDISYFYKGIAEEANIKNPDIETFLAKLFDIVGCKEKEITEEMIYKSAQQVLFFDLLIDIKTFNEWENQDGEEDEDEEDDEDDDDDDDDEDDDE